MAKIPLSLVIPTRNRPDALGRLLDNISRQSLSASAFEVVIVDDGSTPPIDQADLKAKFASLNLKILRRDADHGAHQSRADGARLARAARVLFLDDDVLPAPTVLADHARDVGNFSVGPIFYHGGSDLSPYVRMQTKSYDKYFNSLINGPRTTREIEFFICNASGPTTEFSEFLDSVHEAMRGVPMGGEGFDESIMHIEATRRGYCFTILPDAIVWHVDTRTLDDARRGRRRNGRIACTLALDRAKPQPEIDGIFDIGGVLSGRRGLPRMYKAKLVWKAAWAMDAAADILTFLADRGPKRWLPSGLCYLPLAVAFWQGVRDVAPSWEALEASLSDRH